MKIRYLKHYHGIQPGTIVAEPRAQVVTKLTTEEFYFDDKGVRRSDGSIAEIVDEKTPTTAESEKQAVKDADASEKAELDRRAKKVKE